MSANPRLSADRRCGCCCGLCAAIAAVAYKKQKVNNGSWATPLAVEKPRTALCELPMLQLPAQLSLRDSQLFDNPKLQQQLEKRARILKKLQLLEDESLNDPSQTWFWDENDICPICLDGYDPKNPKIESPCGHHFHLPCILTWAERQQRCPMCEKEMICS